jgi:L-aminopeptidase/D-esterase-like protein
MHILPEGFRIGHWTDASALTGCTVILAPPRTVGSCDVRGASPGSRELALLTPWMSMQEVHAVLLTGGSAFGLAAADGVMRWLEEQGAGYRTPFATVPIVPAAVVFDLNIGSAAVRPGADAGYQACVHASPELPAEGNAGAGTGATVGKWAGIQTCMKGGIGVDTRSAGDVMVTAVAVVNAVGDVIGEDGSIIAGARAQEGGWLADGDPLRTIIRTAVQQQANTTLVALLTNATLSKVDAHRLAQRGHDGLARAIRPVHTSYDGDLVFGLSSGSLAGIPFDVVAELGAEAAARAIRRGVVAAATAGGVPGLAG